MTDEPRLALVSRRTFLKRGALAGAVVTLPGLAAACGGSDADAFADATTSSTDDAPASTTSEPSITSDEVDATTTTAEQVETSTVGDGESGAEFPAGAELAVWFTYTADGSGRGPARNPYIAVWVEDTAGNLVATVSLWYLQSQKGLRWINDLRRWYLASGQAADTSMSSATRVAGSYRVAWDGTDLDGNVVSQGDYLLYIEAAREHGPYSITSAPITVSDSGFVVLLDDDGEISGASAELIL